MISEQQSYRKSFYAALALHFFLALFLIIDVTTKHPVLKNEAHNEPGDIAPTAAKTPPKEIVKAVSVDNQEVMSKVNELKQERIKQVQAEQARQQALTKQAEQARKARVIEQQRLAKLKEEAEKVAIARKKQIEEEQKRLKQLALEKQQETKRLKELQQKQQELKKQQELEAKKLAEIKKKKLAEKLKKEQQAKADEQAKQQAVKEANAKEALAKAVKEAAAQDAAAKEAALNAARQARVAGEVDKYRAMITNAIGRHWILPDKVDPGLSSQFRIRLAPDGAVLEVTLTRSSGDAILDRSAQTAIYKASPLPVPTDPATFDMFREINLTVRPENVRG